MFAVDHLVMRLVFRVEVRGLDNLPHGPIVIAPNHVSYLDPAAVAAALPWQRLSETYWGGWTGTLFTNFLMRWFSRLTHVVPVDPQRGAMSSLAFGAAVLERGQSLVWFPEGERSTDGKLQPFRSGIGLLMERRSAEVVPTLIEGAYEALPPGSWLPRPHKIRVTFGESLDIDQLIKDGNKQETHEQIAASLQDRVGSMASDEQP
jgi:long-chain acyl-CoA synthetase